MSYYLCNGCGSVYKEEDGKYKDELRRCHNILCSGRVFEVDELMIMPIKLLNQKGYTTLFCCSGHIERGYCGGYISFALGKEPKTVPKGWYMDDKRCIRYDFPKKYRTNTEDRNTSILKNMMALDKWCKELPNKNEEE